MKIRSEASSTNSNPGHRPSLYSVETPGKDPLEGLSILGALDPGPARARVRWRAVLALMTVLLLLPATYLVATSSDLRQSLALLARATPEFNTKAAKERIPSPVQTPAAAATPTVVAEEAAAATIVTDASAAKPAREESAAAAEPATALSQAEPDAASGPKFENATVKATEKTTEKTSQKAKTTAVAVASAGPKQQTRTKQAKAVKLAQADRDRRADSGHAAVVHARPAASAAVNGRINADRDKDVDLIAALLTHVSRPTAAEVSKAPGKAAPTLARAGRAPNHDIVVQAAGESKASLISRCRSLGFIEGELCRIRICSGSWGTDPACIVDNDARDE